MGEKLNIGSEIKVFTKDGKYYEGIFMDCQKGYLSTIAGLGIILTFPMDSILNVVKA
jgi:hypothetical protein